MTSTAADFTSIVARWEAERPDAVATSHAGTTRTWAELARRVRQVAAALRADGIGPGDRVAVLDLNHPSCLEITLACAQIGAANAVVNFRLAPPEIVYVINDARARILFVGPEFARAAAAIREKLTDVERVIAVPAEYEDWLAAHEPDPDVHPSAPDDCFVQLYTSGTTGFPKGAMLTHRGMFAHATNVMADFSMTSDAVVQVAMPLFHVGGMSYSLLAVTAGARMEMMRLPDPAAILEMFERDRVTHTFLVPALMGAMAQVPGAADRDYSSLVALSYGASPMPLPVMRASMKLFPGVMHQVYGMTEACGVVSSLGPEDHDDPAVAHRLVSAGTPIHGVEIEVRDPATGEPVPTGEAGEIWVRTDQLMSGYWDKPEASAAAITADGWLRSGDGGHMDADGYVYVTDRIKDMIISGGENIYPAEIERVLAEHPTVGDVAVIGVPDERWGEVPKAVVVAAPGATVDPDALLAYCRENLAGFKCPKSVDVLDELPRNPTGKILKKDLRAPFWEGRTRTVV
ncbi:MULTISPECIES: long-chain-fatty-acid--CoA ligase [unclassified Pseudonocardia]|uniref:long-chain-fatty-acid--CoA ligase n=1 Tax=unclassified Pseudonocardia TaxID=2619320 RepID=UPI00095D3590|nr:MULTISPECIES: long-chain-fatty-acid--CoA ligase [unclassified Pseudonocardia]MBN9097290.1 long-chain-fatty-acid--CoA ligase [Pseudonocardia sp.]OJY48857.1 MAG: long-chain fatty acid--CoA ligase [Pseudonocardia sp. 73-21]